MMSEGAAQTLDDNRDYIESQMIKEALATARPDELGPDHAANAN